MKERVRLELGLRSLGTDPKTLHRDERHAQRDILERTDERSGTQSELLRLQEEKRAFKQGLHTWRKKFWLAHGDNDTERSNAEAAFLSFESQPGALTLKELPHGIFETNLEDGTTVTLTRGELFAAHEWGVWWKFDDSVPPETQLRVMAHQTRARITEKYDAQIIAFGAADKEKSEVKREMYATVAETRESMAQMSPGLLAEKMLVSFLAKQMHDGHYRFSIERATAFDDIERGIDFFIVIEGTTKGVSVQEPVHRVGIQFTTSKNPEVLAKKQQQVERFNNNLDSTVADELILVTIPLQDINRLVGSWRMQSNGVEKTRGQLDPRGPDHAWSQDEQIKRTILEGVLQSTHHGA
jgi:hypothetical protein